MAGRDEVAVVGYAGRLPGGTSAEQFWRLLRDNRCAIGRITEDRFPASNFFHPAAQQSGRSYTFAAGLIDDVWGFDAAAFGMSPREAEQVDPQQRHLLEVTHDALAHAAIRPSSLAGSETAVYVGASSVDYGARFFADPAAADVHMMTGNTLSIIANRLSYSLDLHGPSFTVDTACSSSLVALTLAAEAIRTGQIETAIVAGVNLLLSPFSFVGFSRAAMLSPTGQCRPFDADADGYVRAEGIIVLVLQAGAAARQSRNRIHATLAGWGSGQDGRTTGLSLPSAESQGRLLEQVYARFGLDPAELAFVEAHGTGTRVGDPIEAIALGQALGQKRAQPLLIGSVKSNIGHLEPASGLAGVLKAILALNRGMLPATLHQRAPNPVIRFDELNLRVANRNHQLPERRGPVLAGVSSFGFGGSNAHVVLRGEDATVVAHPRNAHGLPPLLLSAHTREALPAVAQSTLDVWPTDERLVPEFISAAAHLRDPLGHRAIVCGTTAPAIRHQLERLAQEGAPTPSTAPVSSAELVGAAEAGQETLVAAAPLMSDIKGQVLAGQVLGNDLAVAFVFSGNGAQWAGMGRAAWHGHARFRDALQEVDAHFADRQKESLVELLFADDLASRLRHATQAQPLLLALQVATVMSLEALGLAPEATIGHSVGEIAAAWCAGALSLDQAIDVVIARSRHQETVYGSGTMAALALGEREARRFLLAAEAPNVELATINSWRSVTVSGPTEQIERVVDIAAQERIAARRLDLDYPFHSALVDPVRGPLLRELRGLQSRKPHRRLASTVTGDWVEGTVLDAGHWWRNVRAPVRFDAAVGRLIADGFRVFVEIGPKPILGSYLRDAMREAGKRGAIVETLTDRVAGESDPIERSMAQVVLAGGRVDKSRLFGLPPTIAVPQPSYPWRHTSYKVEPTEEASGVFRVANNALLGTQLRADASEWYATIDGALFPWLDDHKVGDLTVFPAACYLEVLAAAAHALYPGQPLEVREMDILRPMVLEGGASFETKVRLAADTGLAEFLSRPRGGTARSSEGASGGASNWVLHARGVVSRAPGPVDPANLRVAPEALRGGPVIVQKDTVYAVARSLGLAYGPHFQRVRHVSFPDRKRALVVLSLEVGVEFHGRTIDVAAFDAAFHALFASDQAGVADMPMVRMLPVRFRRVRVFAAGAMASYAIARIRRQSRTSILTDIELIDSTGQRVLLAEEVLLVEAPVAGQPDARNLAYRLTAREHDRPGKPVWTTVGGHLHGGAGVGDQPEATASQVGEAALLIEAGCLRATWQAFRSEIATRRATASGAAANAGPKDVAPGMEPDDKSWPSHLRTALLWHLETKGLVGSREGTPVLSETCPLPPVDTVVRALLSRHPTMAAEAAALARLPQLLERLVASDSNIATELGTAHWRQIGTGGAQVEPLRQSVSRRLNDLVGWANGHQLLRVLLIGADHAPVIAQQLCSVPGLELAITDFDEDRLEGARTALGEELSLVRFMQPDELDRTSVQAFDVVAAIDSLSEVAADGDGLARLARLMRPRATLIAAEPAPGVFWDIARGFRPRWWSRSVNATFPVGALLTEREWQDELTAAGFVDVRSEAVLGSAGLGVAIECLASAAGHLAGGRLAPPVLQWEGDACAAQAALRGVLLPVRAVGAASRRQEEDLQSTTAASPSGVVWSIDSSRYEGAPLTYLGAVLTSLAQLCAAQGRLAAVSAPDHAEDGGPVSADETGRANGASDVWVMVSADDRHGSEPSDHPLWSAVTAAMRVAQNEYPMLAIHCLGLGDVQPSSIAAAAEEIARPTAERELWFRDGRRWVFRAERGAVEPAPIARPEAGRGLSVVSRITGSGGGSSTISRGTLAWSEVRRQAPGPSEVEIAVAATGLNFRDVMWHVGLLPEEALEEGYAGARLGLECSGRVTAIGSQVEGLEVGDSVMAFVSGGFASHVTVPSFAVSRVPATLGLEEAAGLPVAFLTAYYALVHLAGLKAGETLLVHGAAGAVGLAALQVANLKGAQVIATAGTPEKRALLRALGVKAALDSRTLAFADEVAVQTAGKGVDVVLNSLAGEAMVRSMDCLRPFGRFVELGKRDFYANTPLRLRPFRRNLSYFGVDVDQLIGEQGELAQRLLGELFALFSRGSLAALPCRAFAGQQLGDAFRLMQRSGHIGKIVVRPAAVASDTGRAAGRFPVDSAGWHIVIGGTSGLGLATAVWLGERGARRLILASRSGQPTAEAAAEIAQLRGQGVHIDVVSLDVRDPVALQQLLRRSAASGRVAGIVHAAMVLDDRRMEAMNREAIDVVLQPKGAGALHLCAAAADFKERGTPLDYLLLFSSATTLVGNPGQFNYVAANGLVEGLARRARRQGLPVLAAAWGGIEDTGYLARNMASNPALQKRFATNLVPARTALNALDLARDTEGWTDQAVLTVARVDWTSARRELSATSAPTFAGLLPARGARPAAEAAASLEKLRALPLDQAHKILLDVVVKEIAHVLRLPTREIDQNRALTDIGMDSLMMVELRGAVEEQLHIELPVLSLASSITPAEIAQRIVAVIGGGETAVSGSLAALSGSHVGADPARMNATDQKVAAEAVIRHARRLEGPL